MEQKPRRRRKLYPGTNETNKIKATAKKRHDEQPDFIGGAPNYDKFEGWDAERVLVWLNID